MNLRDWLRRAPKPVSFTLDGKPVAIASSGRNMWADTEKTILAMGGTKLQALDAAGTVIRACELDAQDIEDEDKRKSGSKTEIVLLAEIVAGAYKDAFAVEHRKSEEAHAKLSSLAQMAFDAFAAIWAQRVQELQAKAEGDEDGMTEKLLTGMLDGSLKVEKPKPNGATGSGLAVAAAAAKKGK